MKRLALAWSLSGEWIGLDSGAVVSIGSVRESRAQGNPGSGLSINHS
jgi:hypothetical protein